MKQMFKAILRDERGASIVESLLYITVIASVAWVATTTFGGGVRTGANSIGTGVQTRLNPTFT
ncbi:MAG: Flp family type IVb pilin [Desulforudis sp.]|nr:MAG: Flp family type IVb pilin [Desulforudis sp.]